jgi:hypothetical protein
VVWSGARIAFLAACLREDPGNLRDRFPPAPGQRSERIQRLPGLAAKMTEPVVGFPCLPALRDSVQAVRCLCG